MIFSTALQRFQRKLTCIEQMGECTPRLFFEWMEGKMKRKLKVFYVSNLTLSRKGFCVAFPVYLRVLPC